MSARVRVLLAKEWAELKRRRELLLTTLLPAVLFLAFALGIGLVLPAVQGERVYNDPDLKQAFAALLRHAPELAAIGPKELFQVLMFRQFMLFMLILPVTSAMSIAAYSIVGEKVSRSLEPLLATPITTMELLVGKCLAAAIPSVVLAWLMFGLYTVGIAMLTPPEVFRHVINATALCIIFLITPLIGVLGLSLGIIGSSRSTDPRSAQQIGVVVILPLMAVFISQMLGLFLLTPLIVLGGAAILAAIDFFVLKVGAALFQREAILTRWK
jgi:ABC-2 type transport system permease protein